MNITTACILTGLTANTTASFLVFSLQRYVLSVIAAISVSNTSHYIVFEVQDHCDRTLHDGLIYSSHDRFSISIEKICKSSLKWLLFD